MEKRLEQLREEYKSVPIPKELDSIKACFDGVDVFPRDVRDFF
jgi:hypothetical protein